MTKEDERKKEKAMTDIKYAVVREQPTNMVFSNWHNDVESAQKEAERLARKDRNRFLIIKLVGYAEVEEIPVKVKFIRGANP